VVGVRWLAGMPPENGRLVHVQPAMSENCTVQSVQSVSNLPVVEGSIPLHSTELGGRRVSAHMMAGKKYEASRQQAHGRQFVALREAIAHERLPTDEAPRGPLFAHRPDEMLPRCVCRCPKVPDSYAYRPGSSSRTVARKFQLDCRAATCVVCRTPAWQVYGIMRVLVMLRPACVWFSLCHAATATRYARYSFTCLLRHDLVICRSARRYECAKIEKRLFEFNDPTRTPAEPFGARLNRPPLVAKC